MPPDLVPHDDPSAGPTVIVGVVSLLLLFALIVALEALHRTAAESEFQRKVVAEQPVELRQVVADQRTILATYRWVDRAQGVATIPIDRAMALVIEEDRGAPVGRP